MTQKHDGGSAYPADDLSDIHGMSLRDWFAGQVLIQIANRDYGNDWGKQGVDHAPRAAREAYRYADAMIAARSGGET